MLDEIDREIIKCLQSNSRLSWKDIGKFIHLTGQAVSMRVRRMEEAGIIQAFTLKLDNEMLGRPITAFITVFMKGHHHEPFLCFLNHQSCILESHRISGEGCYLLKVSLSSQQELNELLDGILPHGNYRLSLSISQVT